LIKRWDTSDLRYGFEPVSVVEGLLLDRPEPTPMFLPLSSIPSPDNQ